MAQRNSEINTKKLQAVKKILGQKVSVKNFSRKIKEIGLVGEKIVGLKIGVKNSSWKMDEKNWCSR